MSHTSSIKIRKRTIPEWLTLLVIFMPFLLSFLTDFLGMPSFVKYSIDVAWVGLFATMFFRRQIFVEKKNLVFILFIVCWLIYTGTVYIFNFQSPFYFLWGIRNNLRFYVAFIAFTCFFDEDEAYKIINIFDGIFWINIPVVLFQFWVLGYKQDYLGGIFGVYQGCNAYTSILFAIVVAKSVILYIEGKESSVMCLSKCAFALIIAAMAELKFFFVLFMIIILTAMLLTEFSWRKMLILLSVAILMMFAGGVLTVVFGEHERLTLERIIELVTANNYATAEDLGRFTAIPTISRDIFDNWFERIFGLGLGNCDTSAFAICNTPFYQRYEYLHYSWFSSAFLFLETGYIGLLFNLIFFVICIIKSVALIRKKEGNMFFCKLSVICAILCILYTFYNSSLRKECGLLMYFVLSLPFIYSYESDEPSDE